MVWWIDLAIVLVSLAVLIVICVSLWAGVRRFLKELGQVRDGVPNVAPRSSRP
jgi:hypothetical protein